MSKSKIFKKNGVYAFDTVYANCAHRINDSDCTCNNGYICGHKECTEKCEDDSTLGKCYSFSCPLVTDGASREAIKLGLGDYSIEDIVHLDFDAEDITEDYEKLVVWI